MGEMRDERWRRASSALFRAAVRRFDDFRCRAGRACRRGGRPIGRLGETLRVEFMGLVADVTVHDILPSDVPPGFGYPPRAPALSGVPRQRHHPRRRDARPVRGRAVVLFKGVTPTGDAYEPRNSDAPDALQYAMLNVPAGATANGGVWWDCYRDLVSNVVLVDKKTGIHLAQWNV